MAVMDTPFQGRTIAQKTCVGMGVLFILVGLFGFVAPGFMGMHLSVSHNLIHILSGALAIWVGEIRNTRAASQFSMLFGVIYGMLGVAGFLIGREGLASVGHYESDSHLMSIIPGTLEFGTMDHVVHILIGALFIWAALSTRAKNRIF